MGLLYHLLVRKTNPCYKDFGPLIDSFCSSWDIILIGYFKICSDSRFEIIQSFYLQLSKVVSS